LEAVITWFSDKAVSKGHDVTVITAKGSSLAGSCTFMSGDVSTLNVIETIDPSREGLAEEQHYLMYKELLEEEYGDGGGIVWDNTWHCFSYLSGH
jgi:hypothetical protein